MICEKSGIFGAARRRRTTEDTRTDPASLLSACARNRCSSERWLMLAGQPACSPAAWPGQADRDLKGSDL